ncbi:MAG: hypothetical protein JKY81_05780 [Colwellia sp.]|nr:hypothetical protein [Colwellia sp.]
MYRICLAEPHEVCETWDTLKGEINEVFVNSQYTHVKFTGCDEIMEAKAIYGDDGVPLVFIGLDVTEEYNKYSRELNKKLQGLVGGTKLNK